MACCKGALGTRDYSKGEKMLCLSVLEFNKKERRSYQGVASKQDDYVQDVINGMVTVPFTKALQRTSCMTGIPLRTISRFVEQQKKDTLIPKKRPGLAPKAIPEWIHPLIRQIITGFYGYKSGKKEDREYPTVEKVREEFYKQYEGCYDADITKGDMPIVKRSTFRKWIISAGYTFTTIHGRSVAVARHGAALDNKEAATSQTQEASSPKKSCESIKIDMSLFDKCDILSVCQPSNANKQQDNDSPQELDVSRSPSPKKPRDPVFIDVEQSPPKRKKILSVGADVLQVCTVPENGECLFRAVADLLTLHDEGAQIEPSVLRKIVSNEVGEHPEQYEPFLMGRTAPQYSALVLQSDFWGGELDLQVLSRKLEVTLLVSSSFSTVHQYGHRAAPVFGLIHKNQNHYNFVRRRHGGGVEITYEEFVHFSKSLDEQMKAIPK